MKTAVAYCRMSTDQQEHSIDSQLRLIEDYAKRNNYHLTETYKDSGISGRQAEKRPAFLRMIDDSAKGDFQTVLIYDSSRFARNLEQSIVYKSILKKNNVELVSITEPTLDEDTSLITDALFGAMNEMYSRKLSKNVKRGIEQKALRGEYSSRPPFGYCYATGTTEIAIDPIKSECVKYIFNEYIKGKGTYSLAVELNAKGITTRDGGKIDTRQIKRILINTIYKGFLKVNVNGNQILKKCSIPAIIDCELFDQTQEMVVLNSLKYRRKARPPETTKHWLSGLIRCNTCERTMVYKKGYNGSTDRFRCAGAAKAMCSATTTITVKLMEELVIDSLSLATFNSHTLYEQQFIKTPATIKTDYSSQLKKVNQQLARAKIAYLEEIDSIEEYKQHKQRLLSEIETINEKIDKQSVAIFDASGFVPKLENLIDILKSSETITTKQTFARSVISKIVLNTSTKTVSIYFYG